MDALQKININAEGAIFVVDDKRKLCGVLTDGDIRRLLLGGHNLQEKVGNFLGKDFIYAKEGDKYEDIIKKIDSEIRILPIVNDKGAVVDYVEYKSDIHLPIVSPYLRGNELKYLLEALLSTWISSKGKYIEEFEQMFSRFCNRKYGIAVSNGTVALHLALVSLGIGKGDEVIVPDLTFAATINPVLHANATPVIVDIDEKNWCIDPKRIEEVINSRTKAIIPVHLYGQPCNIKTIMDLAKKHGLFVIEDCAEAHGATFAGKKIGSFGDIGCFSFFGNKIITTGEGGMCVTDNEELMKKMRILRDHGMNPERKYWHEVVGYNYRMTNLQASIGIAQLERIEELLEMRKAIEGLYREKLKDVNWLLPQQANLKKSGRVTWYVNYLVNEKQVSRDELIKELGKRGIEALPFFHPLSKMKIYKKFAGKDCPVAEKISRSGISFPTNLNLSPKNYEKIISDIKSIGENSI